jgi:hypothetical protein
MNHELELVKNKKVGQGLTELVGHHPAEGNSLFDGNNFPVVDVAETGASAALVSDPPRAMKSPSGLSLLQVQDTLTTLRKLAPSYRQLMPLRPVWN